MKVTIIIPIYNVAPFVADCIHSVMCQTWQEPLECILVDDCGTDDSMTVVERTLQDYQGPVDFRIVRHEHNRGLSAARNTGLDNATGDYVYFLDSDDEITPDCIEALAAPIATVSYDLTVGDYRLEGSGIQKIPLRLSDGTVLQGRDVLKAYRQQDWYVMSVNKLYRRSFLNDCRLRFREGILHEDELWSFEIACMAQSLAAVGAETYIYKLREGSITVRAFSPRRADSLNIILKEMYDFAVSRGLRGNADVHHIIQNFRISCLNRVAREAPSLFRDYYREQRKMLGSSWSESCRIDGCDLKKQVRDLHALLPQSLAVPYLHLMLKYYNSKL